MKSLMSKSILIFMLIVSISLAAFPKPVGYVNDFAGILTDRQLLENELRTYEQNTTVEIAVVTIDSLPQDQTLFTYGVELFSEWSIGKKGEDNGILILINKNGTPGNRLRIELGHGIQGYITGAEAGRMLDAALPFYGAGDYQATVESILVDISDQLADYVPGQPVRRKDSFLSEDFLFGFILPNLPFLIFLPIIIASVALRNRCPYCVKGKLKCSGDVCVCQRCGRRVTRRKRYAPVLVGGYHGSGGFGGFGGGGSGGGGAGR